MIDEKEGNKKKSINIDIFELLAIPLKLKNKIIIINFIIITLSFAGIYATKYLPSHINPLPNKYTSTAIIIVPNRPTAASSSLETVGSYSEITAIRPTLFVLEILRSRIVLENVIKNTILKDLEINDDSHINYDRLRRHLLGSTAFTEDRYSGLISISFTHKDKVMAHDIVAAYLTHLNDAFYQLATNQTSIKKRLLTERLDEIEKKLRAAKEEFIDFQQRTGIISPYEEAGFLTDTISNLKVQLFNKEKDLEKLYKVRGLDDYEKNILETEIAALRKKIYDLTEGTTNDDGKIIISKKQIPKLTLEYLSLNRKVESLETLNTNLLNELEITQVREKNDIPVIQVLDPPQVPKEKSEPRRSKLLMMAVMVSFGITIFTPIGLVLAKKMFDFYIPQYKVEQLLTYLSFKKNKSYDLNNKTMNQNDMDQM